MEQQFDYRFYAHFSIGGGLGLNLYPAALAFPLFVHGKYHFHIAGIKAYLHQSLGIHLKLSPLFFAANRYLGSLGADLTLGEKLILSPELGDSLIWDKYGGGALSALLGIGVKYQLGK